MLKAVGCPPVPVGSFDMKYIPSRDKFNHFIQQLEAWLLNVYPALGGLIRKVFETHCPQESDIIKWDSALGPTGSTMLFDLLVNKCAMDGNLLNYFSKQLITELNGLALLQVLCSATFTYTLHTVDVHIQKLISVEPCPSVHQLSQHLTAHSNRMDLLLHMNAIGDGMMARFLQFGVFKRMCEKLPVAMRIINDQERREGTEMDLPALVADLKAYADKEFRDWQAEKSIPKATAITVAVAANKRFIPPTVAVAAPSIKAAAVITPAAGIITPGKCLGLIHLPNNPIILKPKRARNTSRKSPTKSLTPNLINPVSSPILHTSAPSQVVSTSTPTPTLVAGGIRGPDRQIQNIIVGAVISDTGAETCIWGREVKKSVIRY